MSLIQLISFQRDLTCGSTIICDLFLESISSRSSVILIIEFNLGKDVMLCHIPFLINLMSRHSLHDLLIDTRSDSSFILFCSMD